MAGGFNFFSNISWNIALFIFPMLMSNVSVLFAMKQHYIMINPATLVNILRVKMLKLSWQAQAATTEPLSNYSP